MVTGTTVAPPERRERPKGLFVRPMTHDDKEQVTVQLVKAFRREALGGWLGVTKKDGAPIVSSALQDNVSFVAVDPARPSGTEIIGFRASKLLYRSEMEELTKAPVAEHPVPAILDHMMLAWYNKTTIFKENPNAKIMKFMTLGVDEEYENMGLAKELLQASIQRAKELQCDGIMVMATAYATQHLFANKLNFKLMAQLRFRDFEMPATGVEGEDRHPLRTIAEPEYIQAFELKLQ